jgi:hypothetical protein
MGPAPWRADSSSAGPADAGAATGDNDGFVVKSHQFFSADRLFFKF